APNVRFADLDVERGFGLTSHFRQRIRGFYLEPALQLAESKHSFAAGVLVVCAMDALGSIISGSGTTESKIKALCYKIPDLSRNDVADAFCEDFRNGLVHNARIKNGSEFSVNIRSVAK